MRKFIIFLAIVLLVPTISLAKLGVGVGLGKIQMDEPLKAGGIYELPFLPVFNTGDEGAQYNLDIACRENQVQLCPAKEWFHFSPSSFWLEPNKAQLVKIELILPLKTEPGDYFAFIQAQPVIKAGPGETTIGIAAASKLYFTIAPANIWQGIYYRVISFWTIYSPWTWVVLAVILSAVVVTLFRKHFTFQIGIKKK